MSLSNKTNLSEALIAGSFAVFVFFFFYFLQFSTPDIVGTDGYFHIKFSYLMRKIGFIKSLPWLQFTIHRDYYRDHHFLQHVLYIPFTFGDLLNGAKWTAVVFPTMAICCAYWLLKECNIKWPYIWAGLVLVSSHTFLYRISMPRIQSISLACLIITVYFVLKRKHLTLAIFSFFFVWLYDAFIFTLVIALCFVASYYITKKEFRYKVLLYCLAGIAAGIVINPYFPNNAWSYVFNLTRTIAPAEVMTIGSEHRPYYTWFFTTNCGLSLIVFFGAVTLSLIKGIRHKYDTVGLFFLFLLLLLMFLRSRRWVEYWPPFTVILSAFMIRDILDVGVKKGRETSPRRICLRHDLPLLIIILLLFAFFLPRNFVEAREEIRGSRRSDFFKGAALWLKNHTEPKSVVFNTDWDDFPFLFFYNSENYYILGLAPDYMYYLDPKLYITWKNITRGKVKNPSFAIYETFGTGYVVTDNGHEKFIERAEEDNNFTEEYSDKFCTVYSIKMDNKEKVIEQVR